MPAIGIIARKTCPGLDPGVRSYRDRGSVGAGLARVYILREILNQKL